MIHKERGEFIAECNGCGEEFAGGVQEDFQAFIQELKDEGWKIRKEGDEWQHLCPSCLD